MDMQILGIKIRLNCNINTQENNSCGFLANKVYKTKNIKINTHINLKGICCTLTKF